MGRWYRPCDDRGRWALTSGRQDCPGSITYICLLLLCRWMSSSAILVVIAIIAVAVDVIVVFTSSNGPFASTHPTKT